MAFVALLLLASISWSAAAPRNPFAPGNTNALCRVSPQNELNLYTQFVQQVVDDSPVPLAARPFLASVSFVNGPSPFPTWSNGNAPFGVAAYASLDTEMLTEGWNYLWVSSGQDALPDEWKAYAAGYLEANMTAMQIYQTIINTGANMTWDAALANFLIANSNFMAAYASNSTEDPYWYHARLVLTQLMGMYDGYLDATPSSMHFGFRTFLNLQLSGDFDDLSAAIGLQAYGDAGALPHYKTLNRKQRMSASSTDKQQLNKASERQTLQSNKASGRQTLRDDVLMPTTDGNGHCSALVKLIAGVDGSIQDVFIAQTAWSGFEDMLRVYKTHALRYRLRWGSPVIVPTTTAAFSSYGGALFSGDDWYTLQPSGLVVLETTIGNSNATLYQLYIRPDTMMDWIRNIIANRLAGDAPTWSYVFSRYNSGTYNNEFFILDYKKFTPGQAALQPDTFWLLDQAPGYINASDMSSVLTQQTYFGSYNVPAFSFIYQITGAAQLAQQYGPWFSWNATARANIFRRDHSKAVDAPTFAALIRYNDFLHDPLATQGCSGNPPSSAENAVAARDDLNPASGVYPISALGHRDHAAIDAKYTSSALMAPDVHQSVVQAGPTYYQQPVFSWSTTTPDLAALSHLGMPDEFAMPWVNVQGNF